MTASGWIASVGDVVAPRSASGQIYRVDSGVRPLKRETFDMLPTYVPHEERAIRIESAVFAIRALLPLDLYSQHKQELISVCLWKITEADGKWNTRYRTRAAMSETSVANLKHEHVFSRRALVEDLLSNPGDIDEVLRRAVGCVVTAKEHALLKVVSHRHPDLKGWSRFQKAGIEVVDLQEGKDADLGALGSDALRSPIDQAPKPAAAPKGMEDLVGIVNGKIDVAFNTEAEGKIALQELRLRKKAYNLRKYALSEQERALLDAYAAEAEKPPSVSGARGGDEMLDYDLVGSWEANRAKLANDLEPLEMEKRQIDAMLQTIESVIVQVEAEMLKRRSAAVS
jgi:hypothetical protein